MKKEEKTIGQEFENFIESVLLNKEYEYCPSILCSRLFLRENKTIEEAKRALLFTNFYRDKEIEIEKELDYIYNSPIELLKEELEKRITLNYEKGFIPYKN